MFDSFRKRQKQFFWLLLPRRQAWKLKTPYSKSLGRKGICRWLVHENNLKQMIEQQLQDRWLFETRSLGALGRRMHCFVCFPGRSRFFLRKNWFASEKGGVGSVLFRGRGISLVENKKVSKLLGVLVSWSQSFKVSEILYYQHAMSFFLEDVDPTFELFKQ